MNLIVSQEKEKIKRAYVDNPAECSNSVWSVNNLGIGLHVLHNAAGHHDHVLGGGCKFLDRQIDHLPQGTLPKGIIWDAKWEMVELTSLCWNNLVVPKNKVVASWVPKVSPT
jgi:hypothetical protein